jgi:hypothetical protein
MVAAGRRSRGYDLMNIKSTWGILEGTFREFMEDR